MERGRAAGGRSRSGRKLYAKRDARGRFEDIQSYRRVQGQDIKRISAAERRARASEGLSARVPSRAG